MRGALNQDGEDSLLNKVVYSHPPQHTHTLTDGLAHTLTYSPIQDLSSLFSLPQTLVFSMPVRKANRGSTSFILEDLTQGTVNC